MKGESDWPYSTMLSLTLTPSIYVLCVFHWQVLETKLSTPLVPHIPTYAKSELSGSHSSCPSQRHSESESLFQATLVRSINIRSLAASPFSLLSLGNQWPFSSPINLHERIPGKEEERAGRVPQVLCLTVVAPSAPWTTTQSS